MKKTIRLTTLALLLVISNLCVSAQRTFTKAIDLNDYLATITDTLYMEGQKWGTKYNEVSASKQFGTLSAARQKLERFIERKQMEVLLMKDVGGSEKLRLSMLDFLFFEARMIKEAFMPFEKLNSGSSQEEITKASNFLTNMAAKEGEYLKKVVEAQKAYGARNGFTITEEN